MYIASAQARVSLRCMIRTADVDITSDQQYIGTSRKDGGLHQRAVAMKPFLRSQYAAPPPLPWGGVHAYGLVGTSYFLSKQP